jgi:hypothetical protein
MSLPDPAAPRKPNRWGLYAPFVALAVAIAAWSGFWVWAKGQVEARLDAAAGAAAHAGYAIVWKAREVGGYPFRLDVTLTDVRVREPAGWALQAPRLEAEANAYAPTRWLIAAPQGLTFVRPEGGPVAVSGKLIRASLSHLDARPPSFSFEGVDLAFQPAAGAQPFALTKAQRMEFHLRAGPDDEGGVFIRVDGGRARLGGLFARIAQGKPVSFVWNSTLSKMSAFTGRDWPDAVRRWTAAGGRMSVRNGAITAGDALVAATSGQLGAAADGRLAGELALTLRQAPRGLAVLADEGLVAPEAAQAATEVAKARQAGADTARASLDFMAGRTVFGPVSLGPAPKVYDPR